ncbi:MAG: hypothetical protein FD155_1199 [Bacteroidetes bacterium]|nr:MAG: hypothetical protein FD155_1199 [Bacteroidota bacterium]
MKKFFVSFFIFLFFNCQLLLAQPIVFKQYKGQNEGNLYYINLQFVGVAVSATVFLLPNDSNLGNPLYFQLQGKSDKDNFVTLQSDEEQIVTLVGKWSDGQFQGEFTPSRNTTIQLDCERIQSENPMSFEKVYRHASQKLVPKDKNSPEAIIEMSVSLPNDDQDEGVIAAYSNFYGWVTTDSLQKTPFEDQMRVSMAEFLAQYAQMSTIEGEKGPSFQWIKSVNGSVLWLDDRFVNHDKQTYVFTGGAHGMEHVSLGIFDVNSMRFLTSADIFELSSSEELPIILTLVLKKQLEIEESQSLVSEGYFMDQIPVTENYCLTPVGILFHYNSYEIAPYSFGHTQILIPFDLVSALIQPWFKEFFNNQ